MAKIMLVEDDNNLREIYEARLQAEGYTLVSAKDGEEALVMAKNEQPDLIISDVMMPKVSGFEMLDILRNTEGLKDVKVIMLTALGQSDDQQRADRLGANRYLVKSQVTLEDIVKVAHELLNDAPVADEAPVVAEPAVTPVAAPAVSPEPVATPVVPAISLAPVTDEPPLDTQTSAEEQANVTAEIENFVASSPTAPVPEPVAEPTTEPAAEPTAETTTADDQVMSDAIDNLMAATPEATTPTETLIAPQIITPNQPVDGNVPIANKKVINPLDESSTETKPDLNALLAIEDAKDQALAQAQTPTTDTPPANPETPQSIDPNNIAL